jgi:hypothetical protein
MSYGDGQRWAKIERETAVHVGEICILITADNLEKGIFFSM